MSTTCLQNEVNEKYTAKKITTVGAMHHFQTRFGKVLPTVFLMELLMTNFLLQSRESSFFSFGSYESRLPDDQPKNNTESLAPSIDIFVAGHFRRRLLCVIVRIVPVLPGCRRDAILEVDNRHADFRGTVRQAVPVLLQPSQHRIQTVHQAASVLASKTQRRCDDQNVFLRALCSQDYLLEAQPEKRE